MRLSPQVANKTQRTLATLLLSAVAILFFVGGPKETTLPSLGYLWNLGHIGFFFCTVSVLLQYRSLRTSMHIWLLCAVVLAISLCIESIQFFIGRSFSLVDICRNLLGTTAALWFFGKTKIPYTITGAAILIALSDLTGFSKTLYSDYHIFRMAPVLEDFESGSTMSRWEGEISRDTSQVYSGNYSGKIILPVRKYSGTTLTFPFRDWSAYKTLEMRIYNPDTQIMEMTLRINDEVHELSEEQHFYDRFNTKLKLQPGWNTITIALEDIKTAPLKRDMDMSKIVRLVWFIGEPQKPAEIYLDDLKLTN
jgi:VanZ family protein